jgi:hypothetical protein
MTPQVKQTMSNKWWWLRVDQAADWSEAECRAFGVLLATLLAWFLMLSLALFGIPYLWAGLRLWSRWEGVVVVLLIAFVYAQLMQRVMADGDTVRAGDAAAAARLGGSVDPLVATSNILAVWWLDYTMIGRDWSKEERWTRNAIFVITAVLLSGSCALGVSILSQMGLNTPSSRAWMGLVTIPLSVFLGRRICVWFWPEYVDRADGLARERMLERERKARR